MVRWARLLRRSLVVLLVALGVAGSEALGQTSAAIAGRVTDTEGAPLADVEVEIVEVATGVSAAVLTGADGRYYLPNLTAGGPYTVTASRLGLATVSRGDIRLHVGQTLRIDFVLSWEPLPLPELQVRVMPDPRFNPSRMGASSIVDESDLAQLPTLSRNFAEFAVLSPLVSGSELGFSVAGQNARFNAIQIDGALNQDVFGLSASGLPGGEANAKPIPLEAIRQYQVLVAPYDVRHSGFTGGLLNAVTRSGTNEWQASGFGYYRNEALVGELTVDGISQKPDDLQNALVGFTLGGPLLRDRLHLFAAGEFEWRRRPNSGINLGIDDPVRARFAPDSAARLAQILRDSYGVEPGDYRQVTLENPLSNLFARVDYNAGGQRIVVRHNFARARNEPGPNRGPFDAYELSSAGTDVHNTNHSTMLQVFSRLGSGLSNEFLANYQLIRAATEPEVSFPRIEVDVTSELAEEELTRRVRVGADIFAHANELDQDILQIEDNLTAALGRHRLMLGLSLQRFGFRRLLLPGSLGSYRFASLADLEANRPARYDIVVPASGLGDPAVLFSVFEWSGWAQDEWSATDRLTLRYGLRLDVPVIPDRPAPNAEFRRNFGLSTARMPSGRVLFSPRVGFNWRVAEDPLTQLRGGIGLFTGRPPFVWLANAFANNGLRTVVLSCIAADAPPLSPGESPPRGCADGTGLEAGTPAINVFASDFRFPQTLRLSVGVDRRLPLGLVGSLEVFYSRSMNQVFLHELNLKDPVAEPDPDEGFTPGYGDRPYYGRPDTLISYIPIRRSDAFGPVILATNRSEDFAFGLNGTLTGEVSDRLAFDAAYSYSRSADLQSLVSTDALFNFGLTAIEGDPNDPTLRPSTFDRPHKVVVSLRGRLLERWGGTDLTLLYIGQSGRPYSYVYGADANGDGYPGGGASLDLWNDLVYIPTSLTEIPGNLGTRLLLERFIELEDCLRRARGRILARGGCRAPWSHRLDLRVTQSITLGRAGVRVTFDLLNVLNFLNDGWGRIETTPSTNTLLELYRIYRAEGDSPATPQELRVYYTGPVRVDPATGAVTADRPSTLVVPESQWQAQLGVRVAF